MPIDLAAEIITDGKAVWETRSFQAAVYTALFTALSGVCTGAWAVWQWRDQHRWKQAKLARKMLDEIFDYRPSNDAWRMVDGDKKYKDTEKVEIEITADDVKRALKLPLQTAGDENERRRDDYIRWCFDALFYYLERLEQSVQIKIIRFEDVLSPTSYYIEAMSNDRELYESYAKFIRFENAIAFLGRFSEWRDAK